MSKTLAIALVAAALPGAAAAQAYTWRELPPRPCMERDASLRDRLDVLDNQRIDNDRESDAIAREGARLAEELRTLDSANASAVSAYNARSAAHNRRVEAHNRRVADMNGRAARHNAEAADFTADCAGRSYILVR